MRSLSNTLLLLVAASANGLPVLLKGVCQRTPSFYFTGAGTVSRSLSSLSRSTSSTNFRQNPCACVGSILGITTTSFASLFIGEETKNALAIIAEAQKERDQNGLIAVLAVLQEHGERNAAVAIHGCKAITGCILNQELTNTTIAAEYQRESCELVHRLLQAHLNRPKSEVVFAVSLAMYYLAKSNKANLYTLQAAGALRTVSILERKHIYFTGTDHFASELRKWLMFTA